MSSLKPGTLCVIVGGCPENIGLIVEVLWHIGPYHPRADAYEIRTISGRPSHQLWNPGGELVRGKSNVCITDRHKLRSLWLIKKRVTKVQWRCQALKKSKVRTNGPDFVSRLTHEQLTFQNTNTV